MRPSSEAQWREASARLLAFFRRRVRDDDQAEDLLQETLVRVHAGLDELRDAARFGPWLARIARRVAADHARRPPEPDSVDDAQLAEATEDPGLDHAVGRALVAFLAALPETYRTPLALAELEGLPLAAIAERTGLSLAAVKSRVQRGRQLLRGLFERCCRVELDRFGHVLDVEQHGPCAAPGCDDAGGCA